MGTDFLKFDANWPEKLMKPNLISLLIMTPTQAAKSGEIVETLGSTQVMQEKFPVAGL